MSISSSLHFAGLQSEEIYSNAVLILIPLQNFFCFRILTTHCRFDDGWDLSDVSVSILCFCISWARRMLRNSLRLIFQHFAFDGLSPPAPSLPKSHHLMRELFPISEKHKLFVNFQSARVIPKVRSKVNMRDYVWVQCAMCIPPNYILPRTFLVIGEMPFLHF